jgi:hypothetical protein
LVEALCYKLEGRGFDFRWVIEIFIDIILPALASSLPLIEMNARGISWRVKRPVLRADNLTTFVTLSLLEH